MSTKNIDLSKAPADATRVVRIWGRPGKDRALEILSPHAEEWKPLDDGVAAAQFIHDSVELPESPWNGEGLPPIGTACEMLSHGEEESEWIEVQILAHTKINGEDHAVFQYEEHVGTGSVQGSCFRPVRTAQERGVDLILSEIEDLYAEGGPAAIYDAGYRKVDPAGAQP